MRAAEGEAVLREIAEGHAFDAGELAVVEGLDAGEDLEQGGFAGAVAADEADALVRRDQPVEVFEEEFLAEAFAGSGELEHLLYSVPFLFSHEGIQVAGQFYYKRFNSAFRIADITPSSIEERCESVMRKVINGQTSGMGVVTLSVDNDGARDATGEELE